jgi:hypothetical protein
LRRIIVEKTNNNQGKNEEILILILLSSCKTYNPFLKSSNSRTEFDRFPKKEAVFLVITLPYTLFVVFFV